MYTKYPCSLCEELKEELYPFKHRFVLEEIDITLAENKRWKKLYKYEIPVLFLENQFICKHKLNKDTLERNLIELERQWNL